MTFTLNRRNLTEALEHINPHAPRAVTNDIAHRLLHLIEDLAQGQPLGTSFDQGHENADGHDNIRFECQQTAGQTVTARTVHYDDGTSETFQEGKRVGHTTAGESPGVAVPPKGQKDWTDKDAHIRDILGSQIKSIADDLKLADLVEDLVGTDYKEAIQFRKELIARARGVVVLIEAIPQVKLPANAYVLSKAIDRYEANLLKQEASFTPDHHNV